MLNTIERLDVQNILTGSWEIVNVLSVVPARMNPLIAPITPTEIAILGGSTLDSKLGDGYLFNVESGTVKK